MSKTYTEAEIAQNIAASLIPTHHPELGGARIGYLFMDTTPKKGGRELWGKASKVSGRWEHLTELDFIIEIAEKPWGEITESQRQALMDHLLESCTGEEQEDGSMKWSIREPDVQEYSTILSRHGVWNESLSGFIQVAQTIDIAELKQEALGESEEDSELDLNEVGQFEV
jgi:hypothetical protein